MEQYLQADLSEIIELDESTYTRDEKTIDISKNNLLSGLDDDEDIDPDTLDSYLDIELNDNKDNTNTSNTPY